MVEREKIYKVEKEIQMKTQTFPHDIVKELHDGDSAVRVVVEELCIHSGGEEFSEGKERRGEKL